MATFTKIADFIEAAMEGVHDFSSDNLSIALSNTAPASESSNPTSTGNGILANVTQVAYTNYSDDMTTDRRLEGVSSNEAGGVYTLDANNLTVTASGGALPDFQYIYVYNDTPVSPADPLVGVWDHGSAISLSDGDGVTLTFNAAGLFTVT